ncbi:MAG: hypothetical protein ACRDNS_30205, partial [Trebonia sp.]
VLDGAADDVLLLLLLPHPATATAQTIGTAAESQLFRARMAPLLVRSQLQRQHRQLRGHARHALTMCQCGH